MKRIIYIIFIMLFPMLLFAGISGKVVDLPVSARQAGLGGAFAAVENDIDASCYNPAGLTGIKYFGFSGIYNRQLFDNTFGKATVVHPVGIGNLGISFAFLSVPFDNTFLSGEKMGSKTVSDYYFSLAYQLELLKNLSVGADAKYISLDLNESSAGTLAGDIGFLYRFNLNNTFCKKLNLGAGVRNIGMGVTFDKVEESLPLTIMGGFMYQPIQLVSLYGEVDQPKDLDLEYGGGAEFDLFHIFKPRIGYKAGQDLDYITAGMYIGKQFGRMTVGVDYALNLDLETTHLFELKIQYPAFFGIDREEENRRLAEEHFGKARNFITIKDFDNAQKELDAVVTLTPDNKYAFYEKGKIYYDQGNYRNSIENIRMALKIDAGYQDAKVIEQKIVTKFAKEKPTWLSEDNFYKSGILVFEDFNADAIISKFTAAAGLFKRTDEKKISFGRWTIDKDEEENVLKTTIRLPDLSRFDGIKFKVRSNNIPRFDIILVEQTMDKDRIWSVVVADVNKDWKEMEVPFRYFKLSGQADAKIDLKKIMEIQMVISEEMQEYRADGLKPGSLDIDEIVFFKK